MTNLFTILFPILFHNLLAMIPASSKQTTHWKVETSPYRNLSILEMSYYCGHKRSYGTFGISREKGGASLCAGHIFVFL